MKAIILAAGIGNRLKPITDEKCKTLVQVNGIPMIGYILQSLSIPQISEIIICYGYKAEQLKEYINSNFPNLEIKFIENKEYLITNNMYSLFLAKELLNDDIILMNSDLVYDPIIIKEMVSIHKNLVAVDKGNYNLESMKIIVEDGIIHSISKEIDEKDAYGCSIDIYRIQKDSILHIISEMEEIINTNGDRNQWTEKMLDNLFRSKKLISFPFDIRSKKWYEIDNFDDLVNAEILFNQKIINLSKTKVFFIDRDGTLTYGSSKISGTDLFLKKLRDKNIKYYILTNNSSKTPQQHLQTFKQVGLEVK